MQTRQVYLIRHGETEWSLSGRHTGITDLPLTENGRRTARMLRSALADENFTIVLTSPLERARETCELAGFIERAEVDRDLMEWNYGDYEGLTTQEIRAQLPGWQLFRDGCPRGESPEEVGARVDRAIARLRGRGGNAVLFGHGHVFRVFAARWIGLPVATGSCFLLDTATLNVLGYYGESPALKRWNAPLST